ncbi:hypothetical protein BU15DRAFT_69595, partial [Melanogaster broomeanus]
MLSDQDVGIEDGTKGKGKMKKVVKPSLIASITLARTRLDAEADSHKRTDLVKISHNAQARVGNEKGNYSQSTSKKFTLTGRIKNWASNVHDSPTASPSNPPSQSSRVSSFAQAPPSSIFSSLSTSKTSPTTITNTSSPRIGAVGGDPELIGGFADENLLDDSQERAIATLSKSKGKQPIESNIRIKERGHADGKKVPILSGSLKRKHVDTTVVPDSADEYSESSSEPEIEIINSNAMLVDRTSLPTFQVKQEQGSSSTLFAHRDTLLARGAPASRTTSSTSAIASATKQRPTKKVKQETETPVVLVPDSEGSDADYLDDATASGPSPPVAASNGYWVEKVFKSRSAYRNPDLPPICQDSTRWSKEFIPTVLLWCGQQESIWKLTDANVLLPPLAEIFSVVYPDVLYRVTARGSVFGVVSQRIIEWRSNFGSTALAIMNDFFARNKDVDRQALAQALRHKCAFIYQDMDTPAKEQAFRSVFVLQLLATVHIHATI